MDFPRVLSEEKTGRMHRLFFEQFLSQYTIFSVIIALIFFFIFLIIYRLFSVIALFFIQLQQSVSAKAGASHT